MKKTTVLITLVLMLITICFPAVAFADEQSTPKVPSYTYSQYAGKVGQWGPYRNNGSEPAENGPISEKVAGIGGDNAALHITGGSAEGGYLFSFNDNFIGNSKHGPNNAYSGAIDASEFVITYRSNKSFTVQLECDYRISPTRKYTSKEVWLQNTNGENATVTIPLSDFENASNGEWIYSLLGKYETVNFNPVITLNVHRITNGIDITFEEFAFNWYEDDMASEITIQDYKQSYFQNYDAFDFSKGTIGIKRGGSSEVSEYIPLDDLRVSISGFNNKALNNNLTLTATVLNKTVQFNVAIVKYLPDNIESISVDSQKTSYLVQEPFDYKTGSITAHFDDGTTETVALDNPNVTISGFNSSKEEYGQTITVTYGGLSTSYKIDVGNFSVNGGINIENPKRLYRVGDTFDWHTGTIVPENGTNGKLFSKYATVSGFDSSAPCEDQVITVTYGGATTTYTIDIIEDEIPIKYKLYEDLSNTQCWKWGNEMHILGPTAGKAENGKDYALYIEGDGTHGGGGAVIFAGDCGGKTVSMDDGTVLDGLIGADAMVINYINTFTKTRAGNYAQYKPVFSFKAEYQNNTGTSASAPSYELPVTKIDTDDPDDTGYWVHDFVIDLRETYDKTDKSKATAEEIDWLYNMKSVYTNGYSPSIQWRFNGKLLDGDILAIDKLYFAWYEDEPVERIVIDNVKTFYNLGEDFDSNGTATIFYKNGTQRTVSMEYFNVNGFDTSVSGEKEITISYAGKTAAYTIDVGTPLSLDMKYEYGIITISSTRAVKDALIVLAAYDGNRLINTELFKLDINKGDNTILPASFDKNGADSIKIMAWDGKDTLSELAESEQYAVNDSLPHAYMQSAVDRIVE